MARTPSVWCAGTKYPKCRVGWVVADRLLPLACRGKVGMGVGWETAKTAKNLAPHTHQHSVYDDGIGKIGQNTRTEVV
jgi:hypothetical protein